MRLQDRKKMYKMPWSTTDNQGGWIEVTDHCDLSCPGCYRKKLEGNKSISTIKQEILQCQEITNCDAMVIAGGEPLLHPDIVEVVKFVADHGMKPLMLSNGTNFSEKLARELATAGLKRIHLHVDSRQNRAGWLVKNEMDLTELRDYYAALVSKLKTVQCGFHIVIHPGNFDHLPALMRWYGSRADRVHHLSLIAFRGLPKPVDYEYIAGDTMIDRKDLKNFFSDPREREISTDDMFELIHQHYPEYLPAAYINGTTLPETNKYLIFVNIGSSGICYGGFGAKSMELSQIFSHMFTGKYISFGLNPIVGKKVFLLSIFDKQVGKALSRYLKVCVSRPAHLFKKIYIQSLILQQPIEFINGKRNNCDPCINPLVYKDRAINPCQLDEFRTFGNILQTIRTKPD